MKTKAIVVTALILLLLVGCTFNECLVFSFWGVTNDGVAVRLDEITPADTSFAAFVISIQDTCGCDER